MFFSMPLANAAREMSKSARPSGAVLARPLSAAISHAWTGQLDGLQPDCFQALANPRKYLSPKQHAMRQTFLSNHAAN